MTLGTTAGNVATFDTAGTTIGLSGTLGGPGGITKTGLGTLTLSGSCSYTGPTTINAGTVKIVAAGVAGLYEGRVAGAFNPTDPNPNTSVQLSTRYANIAFASSAASGGVWIDNSTYIYTGYINNASASSVTWTFGKQFDDAVNLKIDGNTLINDGTWNNAVTANYTLTPGRHAFELRLGQGGLNVGPSGGNAGGWWNSTTLGVGYDPQGRNQQILANYLPLTDPGDGSLFTTGPRPRAFPAPAPSSCRATPRST